MPKTLPAVLVVVLMDIVSDDLTTNRDERNELFCWKVCSYGCLFIVTTAFIIIWFSFIVSCSI